MRNPEVYYERFCKLMEQTVALRKADANEATTRLLIVDSVLELLGWTKADFNPEERTDLGSYTDYLLKSHRNPFVVVEAKKLGRTFSLPPKYRRREYKSSFLCFAGGPELKEVMHQAADYCNETGAPYAVVTNGWQWIIFRGLARDQRGWGAFPAIIFNDPEILKSQFLEFWGLLSKEQVLHGSLNERFAEEKLPPPEFVACPNSELADEHRLPQKQDQHTISVFFDRYFDDIVNVDDGKMLNQCFVEDPDLHEFERELQVLLKERLLSLREEANSQELTYDRLVKFVEQPTPENRAKVVLVVGRVGAGKSTFLHRFFRKLEKSGYARCILDLLSEAKTVGVPRSDEAERLSRFILERVSDRYCDKSKFGPDFDPYDGVTLRTIYGSVERRLRDGPKKTIYEKNPDLFERELADELTTQSKNAEDLLPRYMQHIIRRTKRPFCLVIDNVDRASDQYQKFVYTFAQNLSRQIQGVIVISLRETTYQRARQQGFLDTRISDAVFQVNPPNLKSVISKRLKYLKQQAADPAGTPRGLRPYLGQMSQIGDHLRHLLLLDDDSARRLVICLANRSVRRAFWLLRKYAESPFALREWEKKKVGRHILRALMLGQSCIYKGTDSPIINIFAVPTEIRGSHFLSLRLLAYLSWFHQSGTRVNDSPLAGDVVRDFEVWGIPKPLAMSALDQLVWTGLVESDNRFISPPTEDSSLTKEDQGLDYGDRVRISPAGHFYLNELVRDDFYKVHCGSDAAWYSEEHYKKFQEEYRVFTELAFSGDDVECDLLEDSKCSQHWMTYLRFERLQEERNLAPSREIAWRSAVFGLLDTVVPLDSIDKKPEAQAARKSKSKSTISAAQLSLFSEEERKQEDTLLAIAEKMPTLSENQSFAGTKYVPRILWILEFARRAQLNPLTAAGMADILMRWRNMQVHATNMAKFLRNSRNNPKKAKFQEFWEEVTVEEFRRFRISENGRKCFEKIFSQEAVTIETAASFKNKDLIAIVEK